MAEVFIGAIERIKRPAAAFRDKLHQSLLSAPSPLSLAFLVTTMLRKLSLFLLVAGSAITAFAQKPTFTVGWSVYAGWTPYSYLNKSGILKKWADKYGIAI